MRNRIISVLAWLLHHLQGDEEPQGKPAAIHYYTSGECEDPRDIAVGDDW